MPSKLCPHLERIVKFIDMIQRWHDQLVLGVRKVGVSIINLFNQSVVYMPASSIP